MLEATARFTPEFDHVGDARRYVRQVLRAWGLDDLEVPASAVVTELATNSVLHAHTDFVVTVTAADDEVRLEVADGSARAPIGKSPSARATTGRGLQVVAAYVDDWGTAPCPTGGKRVWCVLRARGGAHDRAGSGQ